MCTSIPFDCSIDAALCKCFTCLRAFAHHKWTFPSLHSYFPSTSIEPVSRRFVHSYLYLRILTFFDVHLQPLRLRTVFCPFLIGCHCDIPHCLCAWLMYLHFWCQSGLVFTNTSMQSAIAHSGKRNTVQELTGVCRQLYGEVLRNGVAFCETATFRGRARLSVSLWNTKLLYTLDQPLDQGDKGMHFYWTSQ